MVLLAGHRVPVSHRAQLVVLQMSAAALIARMFSVAVWEVETAVAYVQVTELTRPMNACQRATRQVTATGSVAMDILARTRRQARVTEHRFQVDNMRSTRVRHVLLFLPTHTGLV